MDDARIIIIRVLLQGDWEELKAERPAGRSSASPARTSLRQGVNVAPAIVTHVAPLGLEHIGLTGDYVWTDAEQPSDGVLRAAQAVLAA
jgi:hypothetical protein